MRTNRIGVLILLAVLLAACGQKETKAWPTPLPTTSPVQRQLRVLDRLWSEVNEKYIYEDFGGVDWTALKADYQSRIERGLTNAEFEAAMKEMVGKLPEGTALYETRAERLEAQLADTSQYSGIGAYVSVRAKPQPHIVILSIIGGSPAESAGLRAHESIYSIDGKPVTAEEGMEVVKRVRGEADTEVSLEVRSPAGSRRTVKVTRATLTAADTLKGGLIADSGVIYLLFPVAAPASLLQAMSQGLADFGKQTEVKGIIIDLRVAHTSGSWPLIEMLTLYGSGPMGEYYTRSGGDPLIVDGIDAGPSQTAPLVLIVGPDTQGSPEVFAAALQTAHRATVIGLPTPGKVLGYTDVPLPDGSRVTFASSSYKTISGYDLAVRGVQPDMIVDADWDQVDASNDPVIRKALEIIENQ